MNWKSTWILLGLAAGLFAFIFLVERRLPTSDTPATRLLSFKANEVTNIQLRVTNQLMLRVERARAGTAWNYVFPISYPAKVAAVDWLIHSLEETVPLIQISRQELDAAKRTIAEFGLDVPQATLTLQHGGQRTELLFGAKTPIGDGVYVQVLNQPDIYVLPIDIANRLPRSFQDWREISLLPSSGITMNRVEVHSAGRGFTLDIDASRRAFVLSKPTVARADPGKVSVLLDKLLSAQVTQFVTDSPRADLEQYGLQPPAAEVSFVSTNEPSSVQFAVQFGKSPTNDSSVVYARRMTTTNIVLVPKTVLEAVQVSHADMRDLHLVSFTPQAVDSIEVIGAENFTVRRQTNNTWAITEPQMIVADTTTMNEWLELMSWIEGAVEKDVVTDFDKPYGLATPSRSYVLKSAVTNATGVVSNRIIAQLDLGMAQDKKVFARRPDEATVYSLPKDDVARLPREAWQLRDRRVWSFTTNDVSRVAVRYNDRSRTLQRSGTASWSIAEGEGILSSINPVLEEIMFRLGHLHAGVWVARGEDKRAAFGFTGNTSKITVELKNGEKPQTRSIEFGRPGISPTGLPYALTEMDGQTWIFEVAPPTLYFEIVRDLLNPIVRPAE